MNEKIEKTLREGHYRFEDGGDGVFFILQYGPSKKEEKELYETAKLFYDDVQFCPDPESHGEDAVAVLNCFYPVSNLPETWEEYGKRLEKEKGGKMMKETSIKGTCPKCGSTELVLREFDDETAFQYCSACQWAEDV